MVSPRKENSWARKLAKELRESVSQCTRRESVAKVDIVLLWEECYSQTCGRLCS